MSMTTSKLLLSWQLVTMDDVDDEDEDGELCDIQESL